MLNFEQMLNACRIISISIKGEFFFFFYSLYPILGRARDASSLGRCNFRAAVIPSEANNIGLPKRVT
jgi:hypothetical protein